MDDRNSQISLEYLIGCLYGQSAYRHFKGRHSFTDFKKVMVKIFKSIEFAIRENVKFTDPVHLKHLLYRVEDAQQRVKESKNFHEIDQDVITSLLEVFFLLLGSIPKSTEEKIVNRQDRWRLDFFRTLVFIQSESQKINLLDSVVQSTLVGEGNIFETWTDYVCFFRSECQEKRFRFLDWLRDHHPSEFYEVIKLIGA